MVSINNYQLENGRTDWAAYHEAQKDNGEMCYICGAFIFLGHKGSPCRCGDCNLMESSEDSITHSSHVRCPNCKHHFNVHESELYEVMEPDDHEVHCPECDWSFEITTVVTRSFESPAILKEKETSS